MNAAKSLVACVLSLEKIRRTTTAVTATPGFVQEEGCCSSFGLFWGKILCNAGWAGRPNPDANGPLRSATLAPPPSPPPSLVPPALRTALHAGLLKGGINGFLGVATT